MVSESSQQSMKHAQSRFLRGLERLESALLFIPRKLHDLRRRDEKEPERPAPIVRTVAPIPVPTTEPAAAPAPAVSITVTPLAIIVQVKSPGMPVTPERIRPAKDPLVVRRARQREPKEVQPLAENTTTWWSVDSPKTRVESIAKGLAEPPSKRMVNDTVKLVENAISKSMGVFSEVEADKIVAAALYIACARKGRYLSQEELMHIVKIHADIEFNDVVWELSHILRIRIPQRPPLELSLDEIWGAKNKWLPSGDAEFRNLNPDGSFDADQFDEDSLEDPDSLEIKDQDEIYY